MSNLESGQRGKWGESKKVILPLLRQGKSTGEVCKATGLSLNQVRAVRTRGRKKGDLPLLTRQELRVIMSESHMGLTPMKGHVLSLETVLHLTEMRRGREQLTEIEKEQVGLLVKARKIRVVLQKPTLEEFFENDGRKLTSVKKHKAFLRIFYAARLCLAEEKPIKDKKTGEILAVSLADLGRVYDELHPGIFERLANSISFIVNKTRVASGGGCSLPNNNGAERLARVRKFYSWAGVPPSNR